MVTLKQSHSSLLGIETRIGLVHINLEIETDPNNNLSNWYPGHSEIILPFPFLK